MRTKILVLCAVVAAATAAVPAAQASGCMTRPDGTRQCSANGASATFGGGGRKISDDSPGRRDHTGMGSPYGDNGYRLPPFGRRQSGITCYNFVGKPYTYKGGGRCPIS